MFRDCPWCGLRDAQFQVLSPDRPAPLAGGGHRTWSFISCPRCGGYVALETNPPGQSSALYDTFPEAHAGLTVAALPPEVESYYRDAIRVLQAGVPDAAAVQLRRTLEAAAARYDIKSGNLVQRIEKLIERGLITQDFARVLDHIRQVGNVGAHATDERVDEETASRALRFTTQVLRNLFEIPAELGALDREGTSAEDAVEE